METEIRPSEKLKGFIQFLEDTKESYESAKNIKISAISMRLFMSLSTQRTTQVH